MKHIKITELNRYLLIDAGTSTSTGYIIDKINELVKAVNSLNELVTPPKPPGIECAASISQHDQLLDKLDLLLVAIHSIKA